MLWFWRAKAVLQQYLNFYIFFKENHLDYTLHKNEKRCAVTFSALHFSTKKEHGGSLLLSEVRKTIRIKRIEINRLWHGQSQEEGSTRCIGLNHVTITNA